jgi:hypothetical protein
MLPSSLPGGTVEVGVLKLLLDLHQEVPPRGAVGNMIARRAAFVLSRVELAYDACFTVLRVPDQRPRVSFGGEDFGTLDARVVDSELDGLDADFVLSKRLQAGVTSDGEVGGVAVFADDKAGLAFAVDFCRVGEVLLRGAALDPELPPLGELECGLATAERIKHTCQDFG